MDNDSQHTHTNTKQTLQTLIRVTVGLDTEHETHEKPINPQTHAILREENNLGILRRCETGCSPVLDVYFETGGYGKQRRAQQNVNRLSKG